jgi:hypothetical protein
MPTTFPPLITVNRSTQVIDAFTALRTAVPGASMVRAVVVTKDEGATLLDSPPLVDEVYGPVIYFGVDRVELSENPRIVEIIAALNTALAGVTDSDELGSFYGQGHITGNVYIHLS